MKKYQVVLLGTPFYEKKLKERLKTYDIISVCGENSDKNSIKTLYLYFAQSNTDSNYEGLENIIKKYTVLPIVKDNNSAKYLPEKLKNINAWILKDDNDSLNSLVNYILGFYGLLDLNNKVFISYKRTDCEGLAQTLFEELWRYNFHPFLDSNIIPKGVDFQEKLKDELADSAVFLLLNTKNYLDSKWCREELDCAIKYGGIVEICLGDTKPIEEAELGFRYIINYKRLEENKKILLKTTKQIIEAIIRSRVDVYNQKLKFIREEFKTKHPLAKPCDENDDIFEENKSRYRLLTRIPNTYDLQKEDEVKNPNINSKTIIYNGLCVSKKIKENMNWLNNSLPVKINNVF